MGANGPTYSRTRHIISLTARSGLHPVRARLARRRARTDAICSRRRSDQDIAPENHQLFRKNAAALRNGLRRMGAWRIPRDVGAVYRHRHRRANRGDVRAQSLESRLRAPHSLRGSRGAPVFVDRRPEGIPRQTWLARFAGCADWKCAAVQQSGRGIRSLRSPASQIGAQTKRSSGNRLSPRTGGDHDGRPSVADQVSSRRPR